MASINKVILVGNIGRDPETRYMPSGDAIANIAVATTDKWKDKGTGEQKEATEWHRVSAFGKLAEIIGQYCKKGQQVYIEGKDGVEKFSTEIVADTMQMLGSRQGQSDEPPTRQQVEAHRAANQQSSAPRQTASRPAAKQAPIVEFEDDADIPF